MPTRIAVSSPAQALEVDDEQHRRPGLQFDEPLSWRAGKPIAVGDLLKRLTRLWNEMKEMEQDVDERASFLTVAKDLASPNLLAHKDKGVKALTTCCLVDILRLCAPDAPYTGQQLKASQYKGELCRRYAYKFLGYLQHHCYWCSSSSSRPLKCLPSAANLCTPFPGDGQE